MWLFIVILLMGFLELVGIASILPFMQLMAEPNAIEQNTWLVAAYQYFNFTSHRQMLIYFGVGIIAVIALTNLFSIFATWLQYKYSWDIAHHLSLRLLTTNLKKPYAHFLTTNSSELTAYIISEVNGLTGGVIVSLIDLISRSFIAIVIFSLLLIVDVKIALVMFVGLGSCYALIYLSQKNILKQIGQHRIDMNLLRYKNLQELLDGIKTIKVYNQQDFFRNRFKYASREFCNVQPKYNLILAAPRNILEILAFGSILGITIYLYINTGNIQLAIPRLSLYAVAGYRLLPALQKAFSASAKLRHNLPVLDKLHDDLANSLIEEEAISTIEELPFNQSITVDRVSFSYENTENAVVDRLSLTITKGQTIAFVGSTGSGKTTLVDLIVGLLHPVKGHIKIDGSPLNRSTVKAWREHLAYVPQEVFLFDDTILHNIVLGIDETDIDYQHLKAVTKMADIYEFIKKELPKGFQTEIGEKGVRLSGGQRQRLGLARALYFSPSVLVLDEATSALDSITEQGVIESLQSLPKNITTIIIAHRLSTVRHADCIYVLEGGKIVSHGTYESLIHSNEVFKTMVELS